MDRTNAATREEMYEELQTLRQISADACIGYAALRSACEDILRARDVAIHRGERLQLSTVYQWIELALTRAEVVQAMSCPDTQIENAKPYCTVCNSLWTEEDERYGRCLTCERTGLVSNA